MIASLRGRVDGRTGNAVVIDVNGVGYLVHASARTLAGLGAPDDEVKLCVITQVREDAITLFGFADTDERDIFQMLTGVQGVGAKIGLALLSALAPGDVVAAILAEDKTALVRADGVGPRLASRIISELKDKAAAVAPVLGVVARPAVGKDVVQVRGKVGLPGEDEARQALLGLQFGRAEVEQMLAAVREQTPTPATSTAIISACLRLAGGRVGA